MQVMKGLTLKLIAGVDRFNSFGPVEEAAVKYADPGTNLLPLAAT